MGIARDPGSLQADLVKEMAEALGGAGLKLEAILERIHEVRRLVETLRSSVESDGNGRVPGLLERLIEVTREHNVLVAQAEETRRKLLIQREACGFRIHRDVDRHYPIPRRVRIDLP
jgi:hypothetical protein